MIHFMPAARALGALALVLAFAAPATAQTAEPTPQETVRETIGAWEIRCVTGGDNCVMAQTGKGASGNNVIEMRIRRLDGVKAPDGKVVPALIVAAAPLGVLLPAGLRIQVDAKEQRAAPFEVCGPVGCVVRQPLSDDFLAELRAGTSAKITVVTVERKEVPVTLSLNGFTKAYNSLEP